jgi:predicted MFS family arabinose efflux permease
VSDARRLGLAGFCATAVAFGPARNGYGLFLPEIREEFGLSTETLGLIASGLYAGYLAALLAVGLLAARLGPRPPVLIGLLSAVFGMALVAFSTNVAALAAGVVLAGTSAGWSWAPYNDVVERVVPAGLKDRVLSVISTGTTFGIAVAGFLALATVTWGSSWRAGWLAFAAFALVGAALNARLLPRRRRGSGANGSIRLPRSGWFWCAASAPLFVVALSFGVVNAVYWSFAVDLISGAGDSFLASGPELYVVLGIAGFAGLLTGDATLRFGLRRVLAVTLVSLGLATGLLGLAPGRLLVVGASAVLFGAGVMVMSALLSLWSSTIFAERPSTGFSATLLLFGAGSVLGPGAVGALAGEFGLGPAFLLTAALSLLTAFIRPSRVALPATKSSS